MAEERAVPPEPDVVLRAEGFVVERLPEADRVVYSFSGRCVLSGAAFQDDHVRRYGPDFVDRLAEAGFGVTTICPADIVSAKNIVRFGLADEQLFYCEKKQES